MRPSGEIATPKGVLPPVTGIGANGTRFVVVSIISTAEFPGAANVIRIDGLRVEYADGFGLARASNTTPVMVLRFEADNEHALKRIQGEFRRVLNASLPGRDLPF